MAYPSCREACSGRYARRRLRGKGDAAMFLERAPRQMNPRLKKLIGTILMVLFVAFYVLVVAALAPRILNGGSKIVELIFYIVAGLAWTIPLLPLVRWMERRKPLKDNKPLKDK
jgi:hypothetical protein